MKQLLRKLNAYKKDIIEIESELQKLPKGNLVKRRNFYSQRVDKKEIGVTNSPKRIRQLCRKKFLQVWLKQLKYNLSVVLKFESEFDKRTPKQLIEELPLAYRDFPIEYFYHPSVEKWLTQEFQKNKYKEENLIYYSNNGIRLRSKSEQIIANILEELGLPYRYDILLSLQDVKIYPDFSIINPYNGKIFLLEHFGAFNQPDYIENMNRKMTLYREKGYTDRIIYTFESDVRDPQHLRNLITQKIL